MKDIRDVVLISKELNDNGMENVEAFFSKAEEAEIEEIDRQLQAQEDMVTDIERLLNKAMSGELKGFAYVTIDTDDTCGSGWSGYNCRALLNHAISLLGFRYNRACLENVETVED